LGLANIAFHVVRRILNPLTPSFLEREMASYDVVSNICRTLSATSSNTF
jgi:hypothetical protein